MYKVKIHLVNLLTDDFYQFAVSIELHVFNLNLINLIDDACVMRCKHLRTILPVCFVAIVLLWIMACRYVYTALASKMADCK